MFLTLQKFPEDLINIILSYVQIKKIYVVNKSYFYSLYPNIIKNYSLKDAIFKNYINKIVKFDCEIQFRFISKTFSDSLLKPNKWKYNYTSYPNYAIFLKALCIKNNSDKCKKIILDEIDNNIGSKKNKYKKIRRTNNIWTN